MLELCKAAARERADAEREYVASQPEGAGAQGGGRGHAESINQKFQSEIEELRNMAAEQNVESARRRLHSEP